MAWLVFLFLWSVPLIIAEYAMGRRGRLAVTTRYNWEREFPKLLQLYERLLREPTRSSEPQTLGRVLCLNVAHKSSCW